jgi:hypothetical protein
MSWRSIVPRERGEGGLRLYAAVLEDLDDTVTGQVEIVAGVAVRAVEYPVLLAAVGRGR